MIGEAFRHLIKKPATTSYPFQKVGPEPGFRGQIKFNAARCIGCKLCQKDCPSGALVINKVGDKRFEAVFELDKCIYCGQCVESCNKDAMEITAEFELAQLDKAKFKVVFQAPPAPAAAPAAAPAQQNDGGTGGSEGNSKS
jgi:formate hydrogenlyase subunit 6/NADH:ubiquinone oxidoreductase subunit I